MQVEPKTHNKGKVLNIRSIVQKLATGQGMSPKGKHQGEFWKAEVRGQASAASVASVVSLVVRMFGFSAGQFMESPMLGHLVYEDQETAQGIHSVGADHKRHNLALPSPSSAAVVLEPKLPFQRRSKKKQTISGLVRTLG